MIIPKPWLIPAVIDFLQDYLTKTPNPQILEFGSGCSTAFFAQYLAQAGRLISIEHNQAWYEEVHNYIAKHHDQKQIELRLVPHNYYLECAKFAPNQFDLVFIDAKDRMACLQAARDIVKPGGILMLDDAQMRAKYQQADLIMSDWPKVQMVGLKSNPLNLTQPEQQSATAWWVKP